MAAGPLVYYGSPQATFEEVAQDYLDDRLPTFTLKLEEVDEAGPLVMFRWSDDEHAAAGSIVIRSEGLLAGVVLATTDGIEVVSAEHTLDRIVAVITDNGDDLLAADVRTIEGDIVPTAPDLDGFNDGTDPIFASAAAECGSEPPISIDVGRWLGDLVDGPTALSGRASVVGQRVWHYPGDTESIEIRWPATPGNCEGSVATGRGPGTFAATPAATASCHRRLYRGRH